MCSLRFKNNLLTVGHVPSALKIVFLLLNVFASLRKEFSFYLMCSLCFENNFLTVGGGGTCSLHFENSFLSIERVRFAS
jgi:hypothetical protein